jgi:hypothetical protein
MKDDLVRYVPTFRHLRPAVAGRTAVKAGTMILTEAWDHPSTFILD